MTPVPASQSTISKATRDVAVLALLCPFLISGVTKAMDVAAAAAEVRGLTGLEPAWLFAALVIAVQLGGSVLLLIPSRWSGFGALALAGFTIVATVLAHAYWTMPEPARTMNRNIFFEHVAIVGGLLLAGWVRATEIRPWPLSAIRSERP